MNTRTQAEVRRNQLKNNTTRLSPAPDRAICNCWHERMLAGYPPECASRNFSAPELSSQIAIYKPGKHLNRPEFCG
jgi:hypothetical protein